MADTKPDSKPDDRLAQISDEMASLNVPARDASPQEKKEFKETTDRLSKEAHDLRMQQIDANSKLDADEKQILKLYDSGMQNYEIAKNVFKFVNQDTVGKVVLTIRQAHADDWNEVEDINSTKGYTGINK